MGHAQGALPGAPPSVNSTTQNRTSLFLNGGTRQERTQGDTLVFVDSTQGLHTQGIDVFDQEIYPGEQGLIQGSSDSLETK